LKLVPLVEKAIYGSIDYEQSREVGYEELAKSDDAKKKRAQLIKDGKLAPEVFDKAFEETPKRFYAQAEKDLDSKPANIVATERSLRREVCRRWSIVRPAALGARIRAPCRPRLSAEEA